ncbi:MAG: hypothetical protein IPM37_04540 [Hahellaceae bacterium]|nr:hypothetical protein [Hahellaceae bacterium]
MKSIQSVYYTGKRVGLATMKLQGALAALMLFAATGLALSDEAVPVRVTLFSQTYCASCAVLKKYFDQHGVVYSEFNISTSDVAKQYFDRLGGKGTPLLVVGSDVMQVFDPERFWQLYRVRDSQLPRGDPR